jgi:NAD+ kinase
VENLLSILKANNVAFSCVNRVELDRQHLADVDLVVAVGGDGTVLSAAHFLDHGTIPLLGINSDPMKPSDLIVKKKKSDERRSHGALCAVTASNMESIVPQILFGGGKLTTRARIQCIVKSTFSETRLVPALNDLLIANPSPAAVSRFRMGWLREVDLNARGPLRDGGGNGLSPVGTAKSSLTDPQLLPRNQDGTVTRFGGVPFEVENSLNVWSSGMWVSTATGSSAAIASAGGKYMDVYSSDLQYLIREHMIENSPNKEEVRNLDKGMLRNDQILHLRWNSQKGRIFIDGSHLMHNLELGDEIFINAKAPPLALYSRVD